ncbi:peptidylprolyl isomerase [Diaphorobacter limosus]|uniref:Peptidylprolyl isomerase n=1 Tax=Diaphorobacter limosus TaxID=3036128 RepID=A0ABZ0J0U0_9BURK|nr:peptidylprolyl isomerase [Diaphorobacter sp. Y-1]WOO31845.1 peptidylprolyl isomerase [Diaphorobacter sp. Y-1]
MKFNMKIFAAIAGSLLLLHSAMAQNAGSDLLASFSNGEKITTADFGAYVERRIDLKPTVRNFAGAKAALEEMAVTRVLTLEGGELHISRAAERKDQKFDDVYAHAVYQKLVPQCQAPKGEEERRAYYDKNPAAFTLPTSVRLSRIILPKDVKIENEAPGLWLFNKVQLLGAGKINFSDIAKEADKVYQIDPQGDLGWVALDGDNRILKALASANDGDLVGPLPEGDFVYLFQINGKRPSAVLPWEQAATFVDSRAVSYCRQQEHNKLRDRLFQKYGVKIIDENIQKMFDLRHN